MKANNRSLIAGLLAAASLLLSGIVPSFGQTVPAPAPVEKTSFNEVTAQLDPGGDFFLYLGTAQWLDNLSGRVLKWKSKFTAMPDLKPDDLANLNKAFDVIGHVLKDSGIENVSGVGLSSVKIGKDVYRNKALLHHYPGRGDGFLWQLCGQAPHPLTGLDLLPANTALAIFTDLNLPLLWSATSNEVAQSDFPQAQTWLQQLPDAFEKKTQLKWNDFLNTLGGEFGLVITLDESNNVPIPLPTGALQIPAPGLMLVVRVNDDTLFNRIDQQLKSNKQVIVVDRPDLRMRTWPVPMPLAFALRPSAASSGGYLFIASDDALIEQALAVKSGQKPGLKTTEEFKQLAQGLPEQGNQFVYLSRLFGKTITQIQAQTLSASARTQPQQMQWLQSVFNSRPAFAYSVGVNTPEGCLTVGNGSQGYAACALLPVAIVPGMLAAIAIPNFVKARETAQQNGCLNNLRQIDAAKQQWALEKSKTATDVPTREDLLPYLNRWPVCPQGGTYTINACNVPPQCSIPGHKLP